MLENKIIVLYSVLFFSLSVDCEDIWCPCDQSVNEKHLNISKDVITESRCQKLKGFFYSEKLETHCECCLLFKGINEGCKPAKNTKVVVNCVQGLECDEKYVCREVQKKNPIVAIHYPKHNKQLIGNLFERMFSKMLQSMLPSCDCSRAQCHNEVTQMECEANHGHFVDKLSMKFKCQCCDQCFITLGQHQKCFGYTNKNLQYVCETGLFCSPFTNMCIEKREIFSQFMKNFKRINEAKKSLAIFENDNLNQQQNIFER